MKRFVLSSVVTVVAASLLISPALAVTSLTGIGSSFDAPFFAKAFPAYGHGVTVNYQPNGSGAGIQAFIAKTVDFGASDVPMDPTSDLKKAEAAGGAVEQIPVVLGGVSIAYNIPGVKTGLHLTSDVIASIFLGLTNKWNDPSIKKLNSKVKLPDLQITVVHRSDASGTSYIFTDYLTRISSVWGGKVGTGKSVAWPVGVGGNHNDGVAGLVQQTPGAVGYVELAYVLQNHMKQALLRNRSSQYVGPTLKSVAAAAAAFPHVSATNYSIVNAKGKAAYSIVGYSWVLIYKHQADTARAKALAGLMKWLVTTGQKYSRQLDYAPLPKNITKLALSAIKGIH